MKDNLKDQLTNLKDIISSNIKTLNGLIIQSESLSEIIKEIGNNDPSSARIAELKEVKVNITKSIDDLIKHTDALFRNYETLVKEVFG